MSPYITTVTETVNITMPGTWYPTSLPGLVAFYRADVGVTTSGSNVTQWDDQSGNGNHLTVDGGTFQLNNTSFNGHPGINNTTSGDVLAKASASGFGGSRNVSMFILVKLPASTSLGCMAGIRVSNADSTNYLMHLQDSGNLVVTQLRNSGGNTFVGNGGSEYDVTNFVSLPFSQGCILDSGGGAASDFYPNYFKVGSAVTGQPLGFDPAHIFIGTAFGAMGNPNFTIAIFVIGNVIWSEEHVRMLRKWANTTFSTGF